MSGSFAANEVQVQNTFSTSTARVSSILVHDGLVRPLPSSTSSSRSVVLLRNPEQLRDCEMHGLGQQRSMIFTTPLTGTQETEEPPPTCANVDVHCNHSVHVNDHSVMQVYCSIETHSGICHVMPYLHVRESRYNCGREHGAIYRHDALFVANISHTWGCKSILFT